MLGPSRSEPSGDPGLRPEQHHRGDRVRGTATAVRPGRRPSHPVDDLQFSLTVCVHRVQGLPSVSALKFDGSLAMAVGTSTGQVEQN